jgi:hypothetical protein
MKDKLKDQIESKLITLEEEVANNVASPSEMKKNIKEVNKFVKNSIDFAKNTGDAFSEEEINSFNERISALKEPYSVTFLSTKVNNLSKRAKITAATVAAAIGIGGAALALTSCSNNQNAEVQIETTEVPNDVDSNEIEVENIVEDEMSEKITEFADTTVLAAEDALTSGINLSLNDELTEADKETYARILSQYRIVANMDDFTNFEYAELFGEVSDPTEDLVETFFEYNSMIKKHLSTVTNDNMLDYNNLYSNAKDAEVLNESERLIANINEASTTSEKKEAAKAWYSYVVSVLTSSEGNIALSSQALDTLITHSEAYDELTRSDFENVQGAHIDDELEHYLNISKNACLGINNADNMEVEEVGIENLKSIFRISFINKLQAKYQDALSERQLQLNLGNTLNAKNSFSNILDYVTEKIDINKYVAVEIDYIEKQGVNAPAQKSKDDSGVSDGNGGIISNEQFEEHGISPSDPNAKEELEQAVKEETEKQSEESTRITTDDVSTGDEETVLEGTAEDSRNGYSDGYTAGNNGEQKPAYTGIAAYDRSLDKGYSEGTADREAMLNNLNKDSETTYVPVENGSETTTESDIATESYTNDSSSVPSPITNDESNSNYDDYQTEFVPIDESNSNYGDYQTEFVPIDEAKNDIQSEIEKWSNLRSYVMQYSTVASADTEIQRSKV